MEHQKEKGTNRCKVEKIGGWKRLSAQEQRRQGRTKGTKKGRNEGRKD